MGYTEEQREDIANYYKKTLPQDEKDFAKSGDVSVIYAHEFLAVADYIKTKSVKVFRDHMRKAAWYQLEMFRRAKAGEPILDCYLEMTMYPEMLKALAAGDYELFKEFGPYVRNLKNYAHGEVRRFFRVLKDLACDDREDLVEAIEDMKEYFGRKVKSMVGYAEAFEAIEAKDEEGFVEAYKKMMKGHRILCRSPGRWHASPQWDLAIWPLAMVNLARFKGMKAEVPEDEMVPKALMVEGEGGAEKRRG